MTQQHTIETHVCRVRAVLEAFAIDASLLLDTLPVNPTGFQRMAAQAVAERIAEARELEGCYLDCLDYPDCPCGKEETA